MSAEGDQPEVAAPESARREIEGLVQRFARNLDVYARPDHKETQVRVEFIDPFFEALGWDVRNVQGYAELYKDVAHEDAFKVSGATKAPDYDRRMRGLRKLSFPAIEKMAHSDASGSMPDRGDCDGPLRGVLCSTREE